MAKRFLLLASVLLLFAISTPPTAHAACVAPVPLPGGQSTCLGRHMPIQCVDTTGNSTQCCDLASECPLGQWAGPTSNIMPPHAEAQWCNGADPSSGVNTALGCINASNMSTFAYQLITWGIGFSGFVGILLIVYAGFMILTASGDPKKVKAAQELLTAAISGIILIVLSVVILNFLGVNILGLNNLGFTG